MPEQCPHCGMPDVDLDDHKCGTVAGTIDSSYEEVRKDEMERIHSQLTTCSVCGDAFPLGQIEDGRCHNCKPIEIPASTSEAILRDVPKDECDEKGASDILVKDDVSEGKEFVGLDGLAPAPKPLPKDTVIVDEDTGEVLMDFSKIKPRSNPLMIERMFKCKPPLDASDRNKLDWANKLLRVLNRLPPVELPEDGDHRTVDGGDPIEEVMRIEVHEPPPPPEITGIEYKSSPVPDVKDPDLKPYSVFGEFVFQDEDQRFIDVVHSIIDARGDGDVCYPTISAEGVAVLTRAVDTLKRIRKENRELRECFEAKGTAYALAKSAAEEYKLERDKAHDLLHRIADEPSSVVMHHLDKEIQAYYRNPSVPELQAALWPEGVEWYEKRGNEWWASRETEWENEATLVTARLYCVPRELCPALYAWDGERLDRPEGV